MQGAVILLVVVLVSEGATFNFDLRVPHVYHSTQSGDYFGFSVALQGPHQGQNDSWLMVGAAKSNDSLRPWVREPGRVMLCPLSRTCQQFNIPANAMAEKRREKQDGSMFGSVLDILDGHWVSCAPRWMETSDPDRYRMTGQCFLGQTDQIGNGHLEKLRPLLQERHYGLSIPVGYNNQGQVLMSTIAYYIYGEAGFSAHFTGTKDKKMLVLGAPGVFNWQGSSILYDISKASNQAGPITHNPYQSNDIKSFGLLGYAVNSGRFFNRVTILHVAGAPRAEHIGQVILYMFPGQSHQGLSKHQVLTGLQVGEYFGASLAVCDINNDGFDDLLVGAPQFSSHENEGRVFIYLANQNVNLLLPSEQIPEIQGTVSGGRFGTSISCLGDLDQDGYPDVAISAPYEGAGVVYIYNGGPYGLSDNKPTQIINGSEVFQGVSGFGYSLSRGQDMDGNHYNDLAVGAYRSGHVLLFRSRPVVEFSVQIFPLAASTGIPRNSSSLQVKVCGTFRGNFLTPTLDVKQRVEVDTRLKRVFIESEQKSQLHESVITLAREDNNLDHCRVLKFAVKGNIQNFLEPIPVSVEYELLPDQLEPRPVIFVDQQVVDGGADYFCADCPVMRPKSRNSAVTRVLFATDCGANNVCNSHLLMDIHYIDLSDSTFIVGSSSSLSVRVNVTNIGQHPAYLTRAEVDLPVRPLILPLQCQEVPDANITAGLVRVACDIANPLNQGMSLHRDIVLDMSEATAAQGSLRVLGRALTSSNNHGSDSEAAANLGLVAYADVTVLGKAMKELYYFDTKDTKEESKRNVTFQLTYQVEKFGISRVDAVDITIDVPVGLKSGKRFITLGQPELYLNSRALKCTSNEKFTTIDNPTSANNGPPHDSGSGIRYKRQTAEQHISSQAFPVNRTLFVNCTGQQWQCSQIQCKDVGPLLAARAARLQLTMQMDTAVLESMLGQRDIIIFATNAKVDISQPNNIQQPEEHKPDFAVVSATFIGRIPESKVESWVLALSVIGGILLLLLLITGLVKAGFFERKQKDALIKLKRETQMDLAAMQRASMAQQQMDDDDDDDR